MHASRLLGDTSTRLSVAPACAEGEWPHEQWPPPDDPHVGRALRVLAPYGELREKGLTDAVVLRCDQPSTEFPVLLRAMGAVRVPVIAVSPRRDAETVVQVFRGGAGYLVEGDYCACMLSSAVVAGAVGHSHRLRLGERRPSATTSATSTPSSTRGGARRPSRNGSARRRPERA